MLNRLMLSSMLHFSLCIALAFVSVCAVDGAQPSPDLVPRDAAAAMYTSKYSPEIICGEKILGALHITAIECSARVEAAKHECPSAIAQGLPSSLNEKQLFMLAGRSPWCLMNKVEGREFRNSDYDPTTEKLWAKQPHG